MLATPFGAFEIFFLHSVHCDERSVVIPGEATIAMTTESPRPVPAVGVVCFRGEEVLLVRRGKPPREGHWTLPGGRIEWGERAADAALRELKEETACDAILVGLIDVIDGLFERPADVPESAWPHYVLIDYAARWTAGEPKGGDDAADARFFSPAEIKDLDLWSETLRVISVARGMVKAS